MNFNDNNADQTVQNPVRDDAHSTVEDLMQQLQNKDIRIALLEEQLRLLLAQRFGASSEKTDPAQIQIFNEAEAAAADIDDEDDDIVADEPLDTDPSAKPAAKPAAKARQKPSELNPDLPRERIEWRLSDAEREAAVETFFEKVKEELHIIPAQFTVREYFQERAVVHDALGERSIINADRPEHPLGKCMASVELLAQILVNKYCDALPLYRQCVIFERHDMRITDAALARWMVRLGALFNPLIELLRAHIMRGEFAQFDETPMRVLDSEKKRGWMWLSRGGPPEEIALIFDYDCSRSQSVAERLIKDFKGNIIQCDGYASYIKPCAQRNITRAGCWDHARRKFIEAQKTESTGTAKKKLSRADVAVAMINKLYAIERECKALDPQARLLMRQEKSKPQLDKIHQWLQKNANKILKGSALSNAINYALNQWDELCVYAKTAHVPISNCAAENAIRPFAIGRKNWLFAKSIDGANASAAHYSLIETAKANGLNPHAYLSYIMHNIIRCTAEDNVDQLLPWNAAPHLKATPASNPPQ